MAEYRVSGCEILGVLVHVCDRETLKEIGVNSSLEWPLYYRWQSGGSLQFCWAV